ncbi:hypothetical protein CEXT_721241 [Caerostris extrusa]|uniref:Uncharacterized protein n=1 Tax=Caerostris extrusa TaxID=172846 RepID=A0AAV4RCK4_CAEEX|nr:hypothetical protein CEXT_721241 [Caerostris extrusa]
MPFLSAGSKRFSSREKIPLPDTRPPSSFCQPRLLFWGAPPSLSLSLLCLISLPESRKGVWLMVANCLYMSSRVLAFRDVVAAIFAGLHVIRPKALFRPPPTPHPLCFCSLLEWVG